MDPAIEGEDQADRMLGDGMGRVGEEATPGKPCRGQRRPLACDEMSTAYGWLKFAHVMLAIIAVGFNASYAIWLARAAKDPEHEAFALRTIKVLDDRFANPAYALLLVTGLLMIWEADIPLSTFWISTSIGIYAAVILLGLGIYTPTLRRQIRALEEQGPGSEDYRRLSTRGTVVGILLAIMVIVIVFLMVTKPTP